MGASGRDLFVYAAVAVAVIFAVGTSGRNPDNSDRRWPQSEKLSFFFMPEIPPVVTPPVPESPAAVAPPAVLPVVTPIVKKDIRLGDKPKRAKALVRPEPEPTPAASMRMESAVPVAPPAPPAREILWSVPVAVPVVSPAPGMVARMSNLTEFKQALIERADVYSASVSFENDRVKISVPADKKSALKSSLHQLIFKYLSDTGNPIRIQIE